MDNDMKAFANSLKKFIGQQTRAEREEGVIKAAGLIMDTHELTGLMDRIAYINDRTGVPVDVLKNAMIGYLQGQLDMLEHKNIQDYIDGIETLGN